MTHSCLDSPIGALRLHSNGTSLTAIDFDAAPSPEDGSDRILAAAELQLTEYFAGERREFDLPLSPTGTGFQRAVWDELVRIPYGRTVSYGQVAARLGLEPGASRAVGAANGSNPIPIVVPCHRVIGAGGRLTGYGGGLDRKRVLLALESPGLF
ncbi:MAG: methylated-DNA--[protein]-cysteine S-methyltransferase [Nocardioidaceae bacterium]